MGDVNAELLLVVFSLMGKSGLWACERSGEAVKLVNLESVCGKKDEFPEDSEVLSTAEWCLGFLNLSIGFKRK